MLVLTPEFVMASMLVPYLQGEIDRRGWTASDLAAKTGITKSNISKLFRNPTRIPQTTTLVKLARGLDVPFIRLVKLCGIDVGDEDQPPDVVQVAILFESMPELRDAVGTWATLSPDYQRALVAYAEGLRRQQSQG